MCGTERRNDSRDENVLATSIIGIENGLINISEIASLLFSQVCHHVEPPETWSMLQPGMEALFPPRLLRIKKGEAPLLMS